MCNQKRILQTAEKIKEDTKTKKTSMKFLFVFMLFKKFFLCYLFKEFIEVFKFSEGKLNKFSGSTDLN